MHIKGSFCYLAKAFDCMNQESLLLKLQHYGIWGVNVEWLNPTYPIGSQGWCEKLVMFIVIPVVEKLWTMRVPERSVLGPLLFLACMNDIPFEINAISDLIVFGDDTNVIISKDNYYDFKQTSNLFLFHLCEWFDANQLVLNLDKNVVNFTATNLFHYALAAECRKNDKRNS